MSCEFHNNLKRNSSFWFRVITGKSLRLLAPDAIRLCVYSGRVLRFMWRTFPWPALA